MARRLTSLETQNGRLSSQPADVTYAQWLEALPRRPRRQPRLKRPVTLVRNASTDYATHPAATDLLETVDEVVTPPRTHTSASLTEDLLNLAGGQFVILPFDDRSSPVPSAQGEEAAQGVPAADDETSSDYEHHVSTPQATHRKGKLQRPARMNGVHSKRIQDRDSACKMRHVDQLHLQLLESLPVFGSSQEVGTYCPVCKPFYTDFSKADERSPASSSDEDGIEASQVGNRPSSVPPATQSRQRNAKLHSVTEIRTALQPINSNRKPRPFPSKVRKSASFVPTSGDGFTAEERRLPYWSHAPSSARKRKISDFIPAAGTFAPLTMEKLNLGPEREYPSQSSKPLLKQFADEREEIDPTQVPTQHEASQSSESRPSTSRSQTPDERDSSDGSQPEYPSEVEEEQAPDGADEETTNDDNEEAQSDDGKTENIDQNPHDRRTSVASIYEQVNRIDQESDGYEPFREGNDDNESMESEVIAPCPDSVATEIIYVFETDQVGPPSPAGAHSNLGVISERNNEDASIASEFEGHVLHGVSSPPSKLARTRIVKGTFRDHHDGPQISQRTITYGPRKSRTISTRAATVALTSQRDDASTGGIGMRPRRSFTASPHVQGSSQLRISLLR